MPRWWSLRRRRGTYRKFQSRRQRTTQRYERLDLQRRQFLASCLKCCTMLLNLEAEIWPSSIELLGNRFWRQSSTNMRIHYRQCMMSRCSNKPCIWQQQFCFGQNQSCGCKKLWDQLELDSANMAPVRRRLWYKFVYHCWWKLSFHLWFGTHPLFDYFYLQQKSDLYLQ